MASLIEQVETMSYSDLEKLVTALKRKPEKTLAEKLEEKVDDLEAEIEALKKSHKTLETSLSIFLIIILIAIYGISSFQYR